MRAHRSGALREVRSAAGFPLTVVDDATPDDWLAGVYEVEGRDEFVFRHSFLANAKEDKYYG